MSHVNNIFACISLCVCICCTRATIPTQNLTLTFAIIGNTAPESPFGPIHTDSAKLIDAINRENPPFVIHTGNMAYAGHVTGLREIDVARQFSLYQNVFSRISPIMQYAPGDTDHLNGSFAFFEQMSGKPSIHTFNWGKIAFIVLNSTDPKAFHISSSQVKIIKEHLAENLHEPAIVIILHHPLFVPKQWQPYYPDTVSNAEELHRLFSNYPVKAVISGAGDNYFRIDRDEIAYINAGCLALYRREWGDQYRYYIIEIKGGSVNATGKRW